MNQHLFVADVHPTLRHEEREGLGNDLQRMLVELVDLSLLGKHAHWNLTGPEFCSLHLQLDELVAGWRDLADKVAERAVALGVSPDGRISTVAHQTGIEELDPGPLSDGEVVGALSSRLSDAIGRARLRMEHVAEYDKVTEDLFIKVVEELEEQHWMIRVQRAGRDRVEG